MVEKFRDEIMDDVIEKAVDRAYPVFHLFGWYGGTRDHLTQTLSELTEHVLADFEKRADNDWFYSEGTMRLMVAGRQDDGVLEMSYTLDLATAWAS